MNKIINIIINSRKLNDDESRSNLIIYLGVIAVLYPPVFDKVGLIPLSWLGTGISYLVGIVTVYRVRKQLLDGVFHCLLVCFFAMAVFVTLATSPSLTFALSCLSFLGLVLFLERYAIDSPNTLFYSMLAGSFSLILLNTITKIVFQNGFTTVEIPDNRVWVLGTKNESTIYYALFYASAIALSKTRRIRPITLGGATVVVIMTLLIVPSTTAVLVTIVGLLVWCLSCRRKDRVQAALVLGCLFLTSLAPALLSITSNIPILGGLSMLLGKGGTFNGRVEIWEVAIQTIATHPLGVGLPISIDAWGNGIIVHSAHNTIIDTALRFGILPALLLACVEIELLLPIARSRKAIFAEAGTALFSMLMLATSMEALELTAQFWGAVGILAAFRSLSLQHRWPASKQSRGEACLPKESR